MKEKIIFDELWVYFYQKIMGIIYDLNFDVNYFAPIKDEKSVVIKGKHVYPWVYGKLLVHDPYTLMPLVPQVDRLIEFLRTQDYDVLPVHPKSKRKHQSPLFGYGVTPIGYNPYCTTITEQDYVRADSVQGFQEMIEIYAMVLLRNVPFDEYTNENETVKFAVDVLQHAAYFGKPTYPLDKHGKVVPKRLFRWSAPNTFDGPYISQFMLYDCWMGASYLKQCYLHEADDLTATTTKGFLKMIQGQTSMRIVPDGRPPSYLRSGRGIGSMVHNDPIFSYYFNTLVLALVLGIPIEGFDQSDKHVTKFGDTGPPDMLLIIVTVAKGAMLTAWYTKWLRCMKIRPEMYAARIAKALDEKFTERNKVPFFEEIYRMSRDPKLKELFEKISEGNAEHAPFLKGIYNEGSPTHPSFPAGHAVLAGSCITVIKAMLRTNDERNRPIRWDRPVRLASKDGFSTRLIERSEDPTIRHMTINGELNKMAMNFAFGRNFAGVHYRNDTEYGLKLGEEYAMHVLGNLSKNFYPRVKRPDITFTLEKFDGSVVQIA